MLTLGKKCDAFVNIMKGRFLSAPDAEIFAEKRGPNMTDQELKKLHRSDLLELLISQEKENEQLRDQIMQLKERLKDRTIALD